MNTTDLISLSTSVAAFITSGIALFNVIELNKQRKQSLIPEIIFNDSSFNIYYGQSSTIPLRWLSVNKSNNETGEFTFECFNIGLGSAKNIKLSWSYDINSVIEIIHKNNNENVYRIDYNGDDQLIKITMKNGAMSATKFDLQSKKEYILPASIDKESTKFKLPMSYHYLCSILLDLVFDQTDTDKISLFCKWPTLGLDIQYEDVAGNKYSRKVFIEPHVFFVKKVKDESEPYAKGYYEVRY